MLALLVLEGFTNVVRLLGFTQAVQVYLDPVDGQLWLKLVVASLPGIVLIGASILLRRICLAGTKQ